MVQMAHIEVICPPGQRDTGKYTTLGPNIIAARGLHHAARGPYNVARGWYIFLYSEGQVGILSILHVRADIKQSVILSLPNHNIQLDKKYDIGIYTSILFVTLLRIGIL